MMPNQQATGVDYKSSICYSPRVLQVRADGGKTKVNFVALLNISIPIHSRVHSLHILEIDDLLRFKHNRFCDLKRVIRKEKKGARRILTR